MFKTTIRITEKNTTKEVTQWVDSKKLRALRTIHGNDNVIVILTEKGA